MVYYFTICGFFVIDHLETGSDKRNAMMDSNSESGELMPANLISKHF